MGYQTVRALVPIRHSGVLRVPGQTSGDNAQDFVAEDSQANRLVALGYATSLGVAAEPKSAASAVIAGSARLSPPTPLIEPALTAEAVTVAFGPTSQANAYSEYSALGTPTYLFTTAALAAANARRVELDGLLRLNVANEGLGAFLSHGAQKISGTIGLSSGAGAMVFGTPAKRLIIVGFPNTTLKVRVLVDGRRLPGSDSSGSLTGTVSTTSNAPNWIDITLPDERYRVISYEGLNIRSIFALNAAGGNSMIAPPYAPRQKMLVLADSFGSRVSATGEGAFWGKLATLAGRSIGLNVVNLGQGGTGWVNNVGGANYNYKEGLEWLAATVPEYRPDYLWFYGTGNDAASFAAGLQGQVTDTLRSAFALYPALKKIICTGCYGGFNTDTVASDVSARIKAGVDALGDNRVSYVGVHTPDTDDPMFYGTGSVPDPKGDGNADFYFSSAAQGAGDRHPNRSGVVYGADYMARRLYSVLAGAAL